MSVQSFATLLSDLVLCESLDDIQTIFINLQKLFIPYQFHLPQSIVDLTASISIHSSTTQIVQQYQQIWHQLIHFPYQFSESATHPTHTLDTEQIKHLFSLFIIHFFQETISLFPLAAFNPINITILHFLITLLPAFDRFVLLTDLVTELFRSSSSPQRYISANSTSLTSSYDQTISHTSTPLEIELNIILQTTLQPPTLSYLNETLQTALRSRPNPLQLAKDQQLDAKLSYHLFLPIAPVALSLFLFERILSTQFITDVLSQFHTVHNPTSLNTQYYNSNPSLSTHMHILENYQNSQFNQDELTPSNDSILHTNTIISSSQLFSSQTKFIIQVFAILDKLCNLLQCSLPQIPNSHLLIPTTPLHAYYSMQYQQTMAHVPLSVLPTWFQFCATKPYHDSQLYHDLSFTFSYPFIDPISSSVNIHLCKSKNTSFSPEEEYEQYLLQNQDNNTPQLMHPQLQLPIILQSTPQAASPFTLLLQRGPEITLGLLLSITTHGIVAYLSSTTTTLRPLIDSALVHAALQQHYQPSQTELHKAFFTQQHAIYFLAWFVHWASLHHHFRLIFPILLAYIIQETSGKLLPIEKTTKIPLQRPATAHMYSNEHYFVLLTSSLSTAISTSIQFSISPQHSFDNSTNGLSGNPPSVDQFEHNRRIIATIVEYLHAVVHGTVIAPAPTKGDQYIGAPRLNLNIQTTSTTSSPISFGLYTPTQPTRITASTTTNSQNSSQGDKRNQFTSSSSTQSQSNSTWDMPILRIPISMLPDIEYFGEELLGNNPQRGDGSLPSQTLSILDTLTQLTSKLQFHDTPSSLSLGLLGWLTPPPKNSLIRLDHHHDQTSTQFASKQNQTKSNEKNISKKKNITTQRLADIDSIDESIIGDKNDYNNAELHRIDYISLNFESWLRWCSMFVSVLFFDPWVYQYHIEALVTLYDRQYGTCQQYIKSQQDKQYEDNYKANIQTDLLSLSSSQLLPAMKQSEENLDEYDWLQDETSINENPSDDQITLVQGKESDQGSSHLPLLPHYLTYHEQYSSLQLFSKIVQIDFPSSLFSYTSIHPTTLTLFVYAIFIQHFSTSALPLHDNLESIYTYEKDNTTLQLYYLDLLHQQKYTILSDHAVSTLPAISSPLITLCNQVSQIWQHPSATNAIPTSTLRIFTQLLWYLLYLMNKYLGHFDAEHQLLQPQSKFDKSMKSSSNEKAPELNWLMNLPSFSLLINGVNVHLSSSVPETRSFGLLIAQLLSTILSENDLQTDNLTPGNDIPTNLAPKVEEWNDCIATNQMEQFLHAKYPIDAADLTPNTNQSQRSKVYPEEHSVMALYRGLLLIPCERKVSFLPLARPSAVHWSHFSTSLALPALVSLTNELSFSSIPLDDSNNIDKERHNAWVKRQQQTHLMKYSQDELSFDQDKPVSKENSDYEQHLHDLEQYEATIDKQKAHVKIQQSIPSGVIGNNSMDTMTLTLNSVHRHPQGQLSTQLIDITPHNNSTYSLIQSSILQDHTDVVPTKTADLQLIPAKSSQLVSESNTLLGKLTNIQADTKLTIFQTFDDHSDRSKLLSGSFADSSETANKLATTAPKFLSHCIKILQQKGTETSPEKVEALTVLEGLIRSSIFTYDFVTCCNDLYPILLGLTSSVAGQMVANMTDDQQNGTLFSHSVSLTIRERCIISLITCCPEYLAPMLFRDLLQNSNMSSFQQKFDILSWLAISGQELAQGGNPKGILLPYDIKKEQIPIETAQDHFSQSSIDPSLYQLLSTVMIDFSKPDQNLLYSPLPTYVLQPLKQSLTSAQQQQQQPDKSSITYSPFQIIEKQTNVVANVPTTNSNAFHRYQDQNQQFLMQLTPVEKKALFDAKLIAKTRKHNLHSSENSFHTMSNMTTPNQRNIKQRNNMFTLLGYRYFIQPLLTSISVNDLTIDQRYNNNTDIFYKANAMHNNISTSSSTVSAIRSMLSVQTNMLFTPGSNTSNNPLNTLTMDPLLLSKALQTVSMLTICLGINCTDLPELLRITLPIMLITTKHTDLSVRRMSLLVLLALFEITTPDTHLHDQITVQSMIDLVDWLQYVLTNYQDPDGLQVEQDEYSISLIKQILGMMQNFT